MQYSIDGGITYLQASQGVRVIVEAIATTEHADEEQVELHINVTNEGLINDVYASRTSSLDTLLGTSSVPFDDLICELVAQRN